MKTNDRRIKPPLKPSKEQVHKILSLRPEEFASEAIRLFLVYENPSRIAYTALRSVFMVYLDEYIVLFNKLLAFPADWKTLIDGMMEAWKQIDHIILWFRPPPPLLSLEELSERLARSKNERWSKALLRTATRRRRPGQPAGKRYIALQALDIKCAYPETSYQDVTKLLCPCGADMHDQKCRERLRQQIITLIKFLHSHGYDFRWEHIR